MGDENLSTYYMCYVIDGTINLNGGTFNWTRGSIVNTPIYKEDKQVQDNEDDNIYHIIFNSKMLYQLLCAINIVLLAARH